MTRRTLLVLSTLVVAALTSDRPLAQSSGEKLDITAFAVNMSNIGTGANEVVDIRIDSWSSADERALLIKTMLENNADALLRELQKTHSHFRRSIQHSRSARPGSTPAPSRS
jgi:hypothetical protein